jgi:hypothetical protein
VEKRRSRSRSRSRRRRRRGRRRRRSEGKEGKEERGFKNSYVALYCRNHYLSSLHFLATYPIDHGVCFCSSPKSKLRFGIPS